MMPPFGFENCVNVKRLRFLPPVEQKQGILLLLQMGQSKYKILQKTQLSNEEYKAALNTPPYVITYEGY